MPRPLSPSRPKRPLFRFFVVLGILLIVTLLLALRAFNLNVSSIYSSLKEPSRLLTKKTDTTPRLFGYISEVIDRKETGGKWIKLAVSTPDSALPQKEGDEKTEAKETSDSSSLSLVEYTFFLSDKETEGGKDIKGGEEVTISFTGAPSTTDYILAKKVEEMGREGEMK